MVGSAAIIQWKFCLDLMLDMNLNCYDEVPQSADFDDIQHASVPGAPDESGEKDCNNNTSSLCEDCGQLNGCQCTWSMADDHCYAAYRPTVRTHNRTGVKLTRKRTRNYDNWKSVQRKRLRQGGKVYMMSTGAIAEGKAVISCKGDHGTCRFKCAVHFDEVSRQSIHTEHWCLSDDEKRQFYIHTTTNKGKARTRRAADVNKKKTSYVYYLSQHDHKIRVCKEFYLETLNIDAKRIVNRHLSKNYIMGTPRLYVRGKHTKKTKCAQHASIRRHIESIPTIESHYCRRDTKKTYIDGKLNMTILYEKYVEDYKLRNEQPAKIHLCRDVFNHEYNIDFLKPKKDRCDMCEREKMQTASGPQEDEQLRFTQHIRGKTEAHNERNKDRSNSSQFTVCFDMENVFALPLYITLHFLTWPK